MTTSIGVHCCQVASHCFPEGCIWCWDNPWCYRPPASPTVPPALPPEGLQAADVVVMAGLSTALLATALVVLLRVRSYLRTRATHVPAVITATRPPPTPQQEALKACVKSLATHTHTAESEANECAVCLNEFEVSEALKALPCSHVFHERCIDKVRCEEADSN